MGHPANSSARCASIRSPYVSVEVENGYLPPEDPEWIDMIQWCQVALAGQVGWMHPKDYGMHQLINALPNGQANWTPLGAHKISTFSGECPPHKAEVLVDSGPLRSAVCEVPMPW